MNGYRRDLDNAAAAAIHHLSLIILKPLDPQAYSPGYYPAPR